MMRRYAMPILAILLVVWIHFLPRRTAAQSGYVEVTFRCPSTNGILTFDWRNPLGGEYMEAGKLHDLKFRLTTMSGAPSDIYSMGRPQLRSGGVISCDYRSSTTSLHATYLYDVHREIISCAPNGGNLICKLKP